MKILFYVHALKSGGAERVLVTLANNFTKCGYSVYISTDTSVESAYELDPAITLLNHREGCKGQGFLSKFVLFRLFYMLKNMRRIAKEVSPDFVIGQMTDFSIFSIVALAGLHIPIICAEHTNVRRMEKHFRPFCRITYPFAAAITVLTQHDVRIWEKKFKQVVCMPNPCDLVKIERSTQQKKKTILAVGRVDFWKVKGFDNLLKCWDRISADYPDWTLTIAGRYRDEDIQFLKTLCSKESFAKINFLGFRSDVNEIMHNSEVFVLTSRYEGLPMGLIEAMNAGCCCVSFDVETGPSDIITDMKNGLLVSNQDIYELEKKLRLVMEDSKLRQFFSQEAPTAVEKYESSKIIEKWNQLFNKINNER